MQTSPLRITSPRAALRGFTLVELMAVVAMVGILAVIATASVKKYVASSKATEAKGMIGSIKGGQDLYKLDTFAYLNVSPGLTVPGDFYPPNPKPGQLKMNFSGPGPGQANWQLLTTLADAPVYFIYASTAGAAGSVPTPTGSDITVANWPTTSNKPWYVIKAVADLDGDGVNTVYITGSFTNEIFSAND